MIAKEQAVALRRGSSVYRKDSVNGERRWHVSGKCITWKRKPEHFALPVKFGFYGPSTKITNFNAEGWKIESLEEEQYQQALKFLLDALPPYAKAYYTLEKTRRGSSYSQVFCIVRGELTDITWHVAKVIRHAKLKNRGGKWYLYDPSGTMGMITYNLAAAVNLSFDNLTIKAL